MIYTIMLMGYGILVFLTILALIANLVKYKAFIRQENSPYTELGESVRRSDMKADVQVAIIMAIIRIIVFTLLFVFRDEIVRFIKEFL